MYFGALVAGEVFVAERCHVVLGQGGVVLHDEHLDGLALLLVGHANGCAFHHARGTGLMTCSSSLGNTLKPLTRIMSFLRSMMRV